MDFYGTLKAASVIERLRFVLLTGVGKFSKAEVFSKLNNLSDMTMDSSYSTLLGTTGQELEMYMKKYIDEYARQEGVSYEEAALKVREHYNGYRFSEQSQRMYNPFSLLNFLAQKRPKNFMFKSGTPTFLISLIKERGYYIPQAGEYTLRSTAFSAYELEDLDITKLLFRQVI